MVFTEGFGANLWKRYSRKARKARSGHEAAPYTVNIQVLPPGNPLLFSTWAPAQALDSVEGYSMFRYIATQPCYEEFR